RHPGTRPLSVAMATQRSDRASEKWPCKQSDQLSVRTQGASRLAKALDQMTFADARLPHEGQVLATAHQVAPGPRLDLHAVEGRGEAPVERRQRLPIAAVRLLDTAFDTALAPQPGLIRQQAMPEVPVRQAAVLRLRQGRVRLRGGHRDAQ